MSGLPKGWVAATIEDLCHINPKHPSNLPDLTSISFIPMSSISDVLGQITEHQTRGFGEVKKGYTHFAENDVLFAKITPCMENGKSAVAKGLENGYGFGSTEFYVLRSKGSVLPHYLHKFIRQKSYREAASQSMTSAVGQARVPKQFIENTRIPVPPIPEQRRIVAKIEALMARSRAARETLSDIPTLLESFRQSVIESAVTGKLTTNWRKTSLQDSWEEVAIGDLLQGKPRNGYSPVAVDYETSVKSLSLSATTSGYFKPEYFKYIDEAIPEESHLWLEPGDILIQRANTIELVGISAIFNGPPKTFIYPDLMMKCRPNFRVLSEYLHLVLSSEPVRAYFRENATGTAGNMPKINQQIVVSAPAFLPPIEEQLEIVRRVEALICRVDQTRLSFLSAQDQINSLDQSILSKAFRGELVPQDPTDEPAEALLARIRDSREAQGAPARRRGRPTAAPTSAPAPRPLPAPVALDRAAEELQAYAADAPARVNLEALDTDALMAAFRQTLATQGFWDTDEELLRALAQRFGYQRLGSRAKETLKGHLRTALLRRIAVRDADGTLTLGLRTLDAYTRDELIDRIPSVLRAGQTLDREDLMRALLHYLGFQRLTESAQSALKSVINAAIRRGVLRGEGPDLLQRVQ